MGDDEARALAERIEGADRIDPAMTAQAVEAIKAAFPEPARMLSPDSDLLDSADTALHVVDSMVPAWDISIKGVALEPAGHWSCTLRETTGHDDDVLGVGAAPSLPRALIAALLRIAALRLRH